MYEPDEAVTANRPCIPKTVYIHNVTSEDRMRLRVTNLTVYVSVTYSYVSLARHWFRLRLSPSPNKRLPSVSAYFVDVETISKAAIWQDVIPALSRGFAGVVHCWRFIRGVIYLFISFPQRK